jgi:transposase
VVDDDVLFRFRLRLFSLAGELGNVREACRLMGVHPSTYYRWRGPVLRSGLEMLRPRERRPPRMPNQASQLVEQRVVAFALGHPGLGPRRISATLAQERWGGIVLSPNGVWRILRRHGLSRRMSRLSRTLPLLWPHRGIEVDSRSGAGSSRALDGPTTACVSGWGAGGAAKGGDEEDGRATVACYRRATNTTISSPGSAGRPEYGRSAVTAPNPAAVSIERSSSTV